MPTDGCPLAGTSTEGDGRPQVNPDEPMFTYSQVEQICENIGSDAKPGFVGVRSDTFPKAGRAARVIC
ncbi:hypothetical protein HPB52_024903 [Rhipicephalus sanguineus]|uniref:Uncharacterized protein n=1 Tax=Rhipicephalus sanguineus TaxID=34632 RepID=A0A9D4TDP0_RHISA|nr:hypothetical protein HPB52_024903 [Rhipicephalus sanguineus]